MRKLIIVGQTPPPYNGQAKMILQMIDGLRTDFDFLHIRMAYSDSVVSAGKFNLSKILHLFDLIRQTRRALKKYPGAVLYYPPASPNLIPVFRDILFLCAVRPLAGKTIFHFHSGGVSAFIRRNAWLKPIAMKAYGQADIAIELGHSCPRDGQFFSARQVHIVPNGTTVTPPAHIQKSTSIPLKILYVGIHTESKGLFDLLETARELKQRGVPFEIRTAGLWYTEKEEGRFNAIRKSNQLEANVLTLGQKTGDDLWALYAWADLFFFPTFYPWETFGIVQLEAMAFGLPVVASDWPGPRDVILHEQTGFLCPARDIHSYADAFQKLAEKRPLLHQLGSAGKARYQNFFTDDCFIRNMKQIFTDAGAL